MAIHSAPPSLFLASSTCGALQRRCRAFLTPCQNARLRVSNQPISPRRLRHRVREYACFVCDASLIGTGTSQKTLKRSRSVARGRTQQQHITQDSRDSKQDNEDASGTSQTFYISNINELMKYFKRRLDELTMKPLRPVVTEWIKLLEPKRLSLYGPYHNNLPREQPLGCTPPWWPQDVPYKEPSHLFKTGKSHLTVTTLVT
jgi:hypothetical protein